MNPSANQRGIRVGVPADVHFAPERSESKAADRSPHRVSAVLRHTDYPGSAFTETKQIPPQSVVSKEEEAYHIEGNMLNALRHTQVTVSTESPK
jgi:hypothetical protein